MAPGGAAVNLSAKRQKYAGPSGLKGIIHNGKTSAIALFASLGGLVYGYNQGMFAQILTMNSFIDVTNGFAEGRGVKQGMLTAILELGAWLGTLINGWLADAVGRRMCAVIATFVFTIGVIIQAVARGPGEDYVLAGRFITGLGVGSLAMVVPLYNAELAPPEVRGALVAVQQLAITFGIMVSFWIGYGTNYIGGTGDSQSDAAWLIPVCIQIAPAFALAAGMLLFMPQSPRHLINTGRDEECLQTVARLRNKSVDDIGVRIEYLEMKALAEFERITSAKKYPQYQDGSFKSNFMIGLLDYTSLITNKSLLKRTMVATFTMLFQQWNGVNAINYYAPGIFESFGLTGNTISLLATGVVGILEFVFTIPAVLYVDQFGRKTILIAGAIGMASCHFIIAGIIGSYDDLGAHKSASWACAVFIWIFIANFAWSWGPVSWIVVSEVYPLSMRAKGVSIGGSSNWLNNFAVGLATSPFLGASNFGAFIFFGCVTVVGALWVYFLVPETKGKTLEEMDELFGEAGFAEADNRLKEEIERDIGLTALLADDEDDQGVLGKSLGEKGSGEAEEERTEKKEVF